jgi:transmembrane sensor
MRFPGKKLDLATPYEIAAEWLLREEAGRMSSAERSRLDGWLQSSPLHRQAWEAVRQAANTAAHSAADPRIMAMRTAALSMRAERRTIPTWGMVATAALLMLAGGAYLALTPSHVADPPTTASRDVDSAGLAAPGLWGPAVYQTKVGERAAVTLADGSVVTLDTDSAIRVNYTNSERGVRLLRGQAFFQVAKHKSAPFEVYAAGQRITAVGTRFNVRIGNDSYHAALRVALLEGVVTVTRLPSGGKGSWGGRVITLAPGEALEAGGAGATERVVAADPNLSTSWRGGLLDFNDVRLDGAVSEMNRYSNKHIKIADPSLAKLKVSGVFNTDDPEHFAQMLADAFPIKVTHDSDGALVLGGQ